MMASVPHKRPRLLEEGDIEDISTERHAKAARTTISLTYNSRKESLSFERHTSHEKVEGAIRAVCGLDPHTPLFLTNAQDGGVSIADATVPEGEYMVHVQHSVRDNVFKLPFFGVRNLEKLRECIVSSYCYISNELPSELHQYLFTFLAPEDLINAAKVCKAWNQITADQELWKRLYISRYLCDSKGFAREMEDMQLSRLGWKNIFMVCNLFGACAYDIRSKFMDALKTLFGKNMLEFDGEEHQSATILGAVDRFVVIITVHLPLLPFRTTNGMVTFQLALPSSTTQLSQPFNLWSWRTCSRKLSVEEITATHFKAFLDSSLNKMKGIIEQAAREKMAFTKHTIPVFLPLPVVATGPQNNTSNKCEKIIFCVDLCSLERNPFVGQRCDKDVGLLEVVKLGVRTFVDTKLKMNSANQFALCTLTNVADIYQGFTNSADEFSTRLDEVILHGRLDSFDMSSLFSTLLGCVEKDTIENPDVPCVYRCIFIYCRSDSIPVWDHGYMEGRKLLSDSRFYFDVLYLHEKPTNSNMPQEVFDALTDVYHICGTTERQNSSYYCENSTSISRHFLCWAQLMGFPLQRPQQVENLPIVPYPEGCAFS